MSEVNDNKIYNEVINNIPTFDVLILGAGVSGLSAAYKICKKDDTITVGILEANDRVGGRTQGVSLRGATGTDQWDLGGQWIGGCQLEVMTLLKELDLPLYEQYSDGKRLLQVGNDLRSREYSGDIPRLSWMALLDLYFFISKLEAMMEKLGTDNEALFNQWDAMTMKSFIDRKLWTREARESIEAALRVVFGCETCHLSLLYLLRYANSAGGFGPLISEKKDYGAQEMKLKGGTFQICPRLVEKIGQHKVYLNQRVTHITQTKDTGVIVRTADNREFRADKLIVTNPPMQRSRMIFDPPLPEVTTHVLKRMPSGRITKIIATYSTAFWRSAGYSGSVVTNGGRLKASPLERGPLCLVYDATTCRGNPALVAFVGGLQHLEHSSKSPEERKLIVLQSLSEYFGEAALQPLDYAEKNWSADHPDFMDGGPVSVGTPGIGGHMTDALRKPFNHIHFAGTESATYWCGFINGAVESGSRAAIEVLYNLKPSTLTDAEVKDSRYSSSVTYAPTGKFQQQEATTTQSKLVTFTFKVAVFVTGVLVLRKAITKIDEGNYLQAFNSLKYWE